MARLYNHGQKVADFVKEGFATYRLMSDGKWVKSKLRGWKMAKWKSGSNPAAHMIAQNFTVTVYDAGAYATLTEQKVD